MIDWDTIMVNSPLRFVTNKFGKNVYEIVDKDEAWRLYRMFEEDRDDSYYDGAFSPPCKCVYGIRSPCIITKDTLPTDLPFVAIQISPIWEVVHPMERYGRSIYCA